MMLLFKNYICFFSHTAQEQILLIFKEFMQVSILKGKCLALRVETTATECT